jgi:hypothetical protein
LTSTLFTEHFDGTPDEENQLLQPIAMQELFFGGNSPILVLSGSIEVFDFLLKEYNNVKGIKIFRNQFSCFPFQLRTNFFQT